MYEGLSKNMQFGVTENGVGVKKSPNLHEVIDGWPLRLNLWNCGEICFKYSTWTLQHDCLWAPDALRRHAGPDKVWSQPRSWRVVESRLLLERAVESRLLLEGVVQSRLLLERVAQARVVQAGVVRASATWPNGANDCHSMLGRAAKSIWFGYKGELFINDVTQIQWRSENGKAPKTEHKCVPFSEKSKTIFEKKITKTF